MEGGSRSRREEVLEVAWIARFRKQGYGCDLERADDLMLWSFRLVLTPWEPVLFPTSYPTSARSRVFVR